VRARIVLDPASQLVGAQCSGTLMMSRLGLLEGLPACTDLVTKPWVIEAGVEVLDQPFVAHGSRAKAGGCLSSTYLSAWVIASLAGRAQAAEVVRTVAPVGEPSFVDHALSIIEPYWPRRSGRRAPRPRHGQRSAHPHEEGQERATTNPTATRLVSLHPRAVVPATMVLTPLGPQVTALL
jgi:hypothetical protein